jgi:hypothetical protein
MATPQSLLQLGYVSSVPTPFVNTHDGLAWGAWGASRAAATAATDFVTGFWGLSSLRGFRPFHKLADNRENPEH